MNILNLEDIKEKKCSVCGKTTYFYSYKYNKDGLKIPICEPCKKKENGN